jgi:hypothetical protein
MAPRGIMPFEQAAAEAHVTYQCGGAFDSVENRPKHSPIRAERAGDGNRHSFTHGLANSTLSGIGEGRLDAGAVGPVAGARDCSACAQSK